MSCSNGAIKVRPGLFVISCMVLSFLLVSSQVSFAGLWQAPWEKEPKRGYVDPSVRAAQQAEKAIVNEIALATSNMDAATASRDTVISNVPKLFWGEGAQVGTIGYDNTPVHHGGIYYIDPGTTPIAKQLFDTDSYFLGDKGVLEGNGIPVATLDANLAISDLKIGYFSYIKNGSIYVVDTTTLSSVQLSTETGLTPGNVCEMRTLVDWKTPTNTTITYTLKGSDNTCSTSDDIVRAVRLNMNSASAPITLTHKSLWTILLDGRYVVGDFSSTPTIQVCNSTLSSCNNITTFQVSGYPMHMNANSVILSADGALWRYNYIANTTLKLFTPAANQSVSNAKFDRDGYVYFSTISSVSPYSNMIKKVSPTAGQSSVTTLSSFTTTKALSELDFSVAQTYVVYDFPNSENSGAVIRSVLKSPTAGVPLTFITLADSSVNGGVVGSCLFSENKLGQTSRVNLDGTGKITLSGTQLTGASMGGKGDWFYRFDTTTFRGIICTGTVLKSAGYSDNFTIGVSKTLGALPVNLSNPTFMQTGNDMIGTAQKRGTDYSQGRDILYLKADTAASYLRLTNSNVGKLVAEPDF